MIVVLVFLLRPFFVVRFSMIPDQRIGHFVQDLAIYILDRDRKKKKKINTPFDFFAYNNNRYLSNKFLKKKWDEKIYIGNEHLIFLIIFIIKKICSFLSIKNIHDVNLTEFDDLDLIYQNKSPLITFTEDEEKKGQKILEKMGIKKSEKFILLMIRDKNYLDLKFPNQDWSYHNYRDLNLEDFTKTVNMLIDKGFSVIRMGQNSSDMFPLKRDKFIDYAKSEHRSDFMDFYLCANSYFCISTVYGLDSVARIFKKPILGIQYPFTNRCIFNHYDLITLPIIIDKKSKEQIKLKVFLKMMLNEEKSFSSRVLKKFNLDYLPNSSDEIMYACLEMIEKQKKNINSIDQDEFWKTIIKYLSNKKELNNFNMQSKRTKVCNVFYLKYKEFLIN